MLCFFAPTPKHPSWPKIELAMSLSAIFRTRLLKMDGFTTSSANGWTAANAAALRAGWSAVLAIRHRR
jgi:hypothetical protein